MNNRTRLTAHVRHLRSKRHPTEDERLSLELLESLGLEIDRLRAENEELRRPGDAQTQAEGGEE